MTSDQLGDNPTGDSPASSTVMTQLGLTVDVDDLLPRRRTVTAKSSRPPSARFCGGDMTWLQQFMGADPDPVLQPIIARITALLMGRTTFDGEDPNAGDPELEGTFEGQWSGPQILLTHRPVEQQAPGLTAVGDLSAAVSASRHTAGPEGVVNVLGADVAGQCLAAGVLHELIISTVPILLGGGTPLLRGLDGSRTLTLIRSSPTSTGHTAHYRLPNQQR